MMPRVRCIAGIVLLLAGGSLAFQGCPSPAAPPAPPAEIPSLLTIPSNLALDVNELSGTSAPAGLKLQTVTPRQTQTSISIATGSIKELNQFLDNVLAPISHTDIPVAATLTSFENSFTPSPTDPAFDLKFDFGRFDLDGDGALEACSGCTCPVGCAPDLAVCPSEAPEEELKPICMRIWLNGARLMAGVFDRIPTFDNPQSGRLRFQLPAFVDTGLSLISIFYDHSSPSDKRTEMRSFQRDTDVDPNLFFSNSHQLVRVEGPEATAKKTVKLTSSFLSPPASSGGTLQFQAAYIANLDFISLEELTDGLFGIESEGGLLGLPDITPPLCAQISTGNPASDVLCEDLQINVTSGEFLDLPVIPDTDLPPVSQFPESPTF